MQANTQDPQGLVKPRHDHALVFCAVWALVPVAGGCSYSLTDADRAVITPRVGRVLAYGNQAPRSSPTGVAVVYSHREDINLKLAWEAFQRFDLHKGRRIYNELVRLRAIRPDEVFVPAEADDATLLLAHDRRYLDSLDDRGMVAEIFGSGFPLWQSPQDHRERIVGACRTAVGGTVLGGELALAHGLAIHLGGGFTHAFAGRGGRACLLADVPVAIRSLRQRQLVQRILVIDLGALQANGIASFLASDPDARLLDIYERNNYPPTKQPEPDGVPLADKVTISEYRLALESRLPRLLDEFKPQLVFYIAGVDVAKGDPDGRSGLTAEGLVFRDLYVAQQVRSRDIPLCVVLGGGWGPESWRLHLRSIRGLLARYGGVPFKTTAKDK